MVVGSHEDGAPLAHPACSVVRAAATANIHKLIPFRDVVVVLVY